VPESGTISVAHQGLARLAQALRSASARQGVPDPADARVANLDHVLGVAYRGARACFTRSGSSARQQPKIAVHSHSTFIG